ncbi:hypothetical protein [Anaerotignum sp.]
MKRALAAALTWSLIFGMTGCDTKTQETPIDPSAEIELPAESGEVSITWGNDTAEKPAEMLTDLTEDIIASILKESYTGKRQFEAYDFEIKKLENLEGSLEMDFDLGVTYRELTEDTNPAMPLIVGEEVLHMELPLRLTAYTEKDNIQTEGLFLAVREDELTEQDKWHLITEELPDFAEVGTFIGTIQFDEKGNLNLNRKFWIEETHGYTDNGYFLMETNASYSVPVDEACEISYYAGASTVESMTLEELKQMEHLEEHLFMVTQENGNIRYIIELYRP